MLLLLLFQTNVLPSTPEVNEDFFKLPTAELIGKPYQACIDVIRK